MRWKGAQVRARLFLVVCLALLGAAGLGSAISSENHAAPLPKVTYVKFEDPFEHAFTAEVPEGWEAKGGVYRLGLSDARVVLDLRSPDGKITASGRRGNSTLAPPNCLNSLPTIHSPS